MGARFDGLSYLKNISGWRPAYPYAVGMWAFPTATTAGQTLFGNGYTANQTFERVTLSTTCTIGSNAGGGEVVATAAGAITANQWYFVVGRFVSATERRISLYSPSTGVSHGNSATSSAPATDTTLIGANFSLNSAQNQFTGVIAEYWSTQGTDCWIPGNHFPNEVFLKLAFGGPFSIGLVDRSLLEYRSFRQGPVEFYGAGDRDLFTRRLQMQRWDRVATVYGGIHPPLPYWYRRKPRELIKIRLPQFAALTDAGPPPLPVTGSTLWKPDTCDCVLEYWNVDESFKESHVACGIHSALFGTPEHLSEVLAHNKAN
jgi:hypothetical protein